MTGEKNAKEGLRDCARLVLEHIGLGEPPAAYFDDLERVDAAAIAWYRERFPTLGPPGFNLPDITEGDAVLTGNLCDAEAAGFLCNEAARDFVRYVDERSARRGTLLMLQVLVAIRVALQPRANAPGGHA